MSSVFARLFAYLDVTGTCEDLCCCVKSLLVICPYRLMKISTAANDLDPENVKSHLQQKDPRILAFYEENGTLTEKCRRALPSASCEGTLL
ncbi:uncharacterized protein LOC115577920 isoform X1 [Scomber scombrus]|uniref:Uncharacterized protein LOC115577920 isoform X1 n=1 Tax=Scomber scombrus TaxID=13677 RepID=A0AAV1PS79_SCOSC